MNAQLKTPDRPPPPIYDSVRREEIGRKHEADPDLFREWQDIAAQEAGISRAGEI